MILDKVKIAVIGQGYVGLPLINCYIESGFKVIGIDHFNEIELSAKKFKIDFIYTQKGGEKNHWISYKIKTLVHYVYPQHL